MNRSVRTWAGRGVAAAALAALALPQVSQAATTSQTYSHIYVIMEENTNYEDLIGNTTDAPYINSLAQTYGFAANYYGVTHPSLPNYVAAISGSYFGVNKDDASARFSGQNIVDQLESKGVTWAAYMQSLPSAGYLGDQYPTTGAGLYVAKHNPFVLFNDVRSNPARLQNVKPIQQLATDLATGSAPNFAFIVPDVCHDMHGMSSSSAATYGMSSCAYPPLDTTAHALIQAGDQYLHQLVTTIMGSKGWTSDSAIVVTWDENDYAGSKANRGYSSNTGCCGSLPNDGGGRVPAIVITSSGGHTVSLRPYNHYSLLRTIENNFGLPCLNNTCDAAVQPMSDLLPPAGANAVPLSATQGFAVTFTSSSAGQGYVLFGPTCDSLVETATNDLGAGTTTHTVLVTGNDLPGVVGNIGLSPGATYAYEVLTNSAQGNQIDNNNGQCYSVTISKPA